MASLIEKYEQPNFGSFPIFPSLVRSIISQQLSGVAASTIYERLKKISDISPESLLDVDVDQLNACGISRQKIFYIKNTSRASIAGLLYKIDELPDDEVVKILTKIKGIGRWTAEMTLIFSLGRKNVWPLADSGLLRAAKILYGVINCEQFFFLGNQFVPYRSYAAWYLWRFLDK